MEQDTIRNVPGIGPVNFPGMDPQEIDAQVERLSNEAMRPMNTPTTPTGGAGTRFAEGAWKNLNPMGLVQAAVHPVDTLGALIDAQLDQFKQAKRLYDNGNYHGALNTMASLSDVAGHVGAGLLPLVGPPAARAGERLASGDIAGGLGEATGLIAATQAPKLIPKAVGATVSGAKAVAPVLTQPAWGALSDLVGIVKPGYANGMRLAQRAAEAIAPAPAAPPPAAAPAPAAPPPAAPPIPPGTGTGAAPIIGVSTAPAGWQGNVGAFVNQFPRTAAAAPAAGAPAAGAAAAPAAAAAAAPALSAAEQAAAALTDAGLSATKAAKLIQGWTRQGVTDLARAAKFYADSFLKD